MKKVKEYLDTNLFSQGESSCELKKNGHFCVQGHWIYPQNWHGNFGVEEFMNLSQKERKKYKAPDHISVTINNETIIVGNMSVGGIWSRYHYLQTYEHIPRGEPDKFGYYARSTEDEIIEYIDDFYQKIISNNTKK